MTLPSATTRLSVQAGTAPISTDLIAVWGACTTLADGTPRLYSRVADMLAAHGYSESLEYAALHMQDTKKPILFVPLPISTTGTVGRFKSTGNSGSCAVTCAASASGVLAETDGVLVVTTGGTIGTSQIMLSLSLDGGTTYKPVRLGTNSTYVIPNVGLTLSFAAGTLVAGDTVLTWHSVAPLPDFTSLATPLAAMQAQKLLTRSWLFVGDVSTLVSANGIKSQVNAYETSTDRYTYAKANTRDRLPVASLSQVRVSMAGAPNLTFLEVGGTGDTATRSAGSFITDGFVLGDTIRVTGAVTGSGHNNVTGVPTAITATVLTMGATDFDNEGPIAGVSITAEPTLTFTASTHSILRSRGSWLDDGFRIGDSITVTGTASNNFTATITALTATLMSFAAGAVDEIIGSIGVSVVTGETDSAAIAALDGVLASVTNAPRIDIAYGRLRKLSPITGYTMRRSAQWADSIRSYQHDVRTTTWWKDLGPLDGWSSDGEYDERVTGVALAARFTCARTWANGPSGAFIAQSLTRATDGNILGMTHNVAVCNVAQTVCQKVTENFAGGVLVLNPADNTGKRTATTASLKVLEAKVNSELQRNLLSNVGGEGQRASIATWTAATDDDLGVADATLHGVLNLQLNGTIVHIATTVEVR